MGVEKEIVHQGTGTGYPKAGQTVTVHYFQGCVVFLASLPYQGKINSPAGTTILAFWGTICIELKGTLADGTKFDSSRDRKTPFTFQIGIAQVIKGWDEGVASMRVGERARLTCSPDYAFGSRGYPGVIPPNAVVVIDVELLKVE